MTKEGAHGVDGGGLRVGSSASHSRLSARGCLLRPWPSEGDYEHNRLNHDTNSHAHIRAAVIGPSETLPLRAGRLGTGTWQQIVLVDFDDRPRQRTVTVQVFS